MSGGGRRSFGLLIALLVVAHFLLHLGLGIERAAPDLLTVATLLAARRLRAGAAAAVGLGLGLLADALSLFAFGANAVVLALLGYLGARTRDLFVGDSLMFAAVYLFLGKWAHDALYALLAGSPGADGAVTRLLVQAPIAAVYAAVAGVAALLVYRVVTGER